MCNGSETADEVAPQAPLARAGRRSYRRLWSSTRVVRHDGRLTVVKGVDETEERSWRVRQ